MSSLDTHPRDSEMNVSDSTDASQVITSPADIEQAFPQYAGTVTFDPSYTGLDEENPPEWENDTYEFDKATILARVLAGIDNCVLLSVHEETPDEVFDSRSPSTFGGLLAAAPAEQSSNEESVLTVRNAHHSVVLYSAALMVARYEKELTTRVLANAPESAVAPVNRKYLQEKRELQRRSEARQDSEVVTIPRDAVSVYSVSCAGAVSNIFSSR